MKKLMMVFTASVVLVGVCLVLILTPSMKCRCVEVTEGSLKLSMELDKLEFRLDENESFRIKFRVENLGNETVAVTTVNPLSWTVEQTSYQSVHGLYLEEFHFGLRILQVNETEIYDITHGLQPVAHTFEIDSGDWIQQVVAWNYYDPAGYDLPQGVYKIRGFFQYESTGNPLYGIETPPIVFVIR